MNLGCVRLENISVPPEVEQAIDKRSSMAAVSNLNDYVKYQTAQGMERGTSGAGGMATEVAVGLAMAQQIMQQQGGLPGTTPAVDPQPAATVSTGLPELLTPAQVAKILNVSEGDVVASIESGDLKGKKVGSTYRITRKALEQFLES